MNSSVGLITNTPFDIEIIYDGVPTGRYINRGVDIITTDDGRPVIGDSNYTYSNASGTLFCIPGIEFKFSVDNSVDANNDANANETGSLKYNVSKDHILWDFSDGTTSHEYEPIHAFNQPGVYRIQVRMYDDSGFPRDNPYTYTLRLTNVVGDQVTWDTPIFRSTGIEYTPASTPLPVNLRRTSSWQSPESFKTITMYCSGSNSIPGEHETYMKNKHAHLQRLWRFVKDYTDPVPVTSLHSPGDPVRISNIINSLSTDLQLPTTMSPEITTAINSTGTITVGTSAAEQVYFIDDTVKNYLSRDTQPVFLFASLSSDSVNELSVETPVSVLPVKITYAPATKLLLSTNGMQSYTLNSTMYNHSTYNINAALINDFGNIIKTDYPQLSLTDQSVLPAFGVRFDLTDHNGHDINFTSQERDVSIETRGSRNFLINPQSDTQHAANLTARTYVSDPAYCPVDTLFHVLTNVYKSNAHFITPGYADASLESGGSFITNSDNTYQADINTASLNAGVSAVDINNTSFAVCVDPIEQIAYIGDQTNDTLLMFDRSGNQLNSGEPIPLLDLICHSRIFDNDSRFRYVDISSGVELMTSLVGASEDNIPHKFFENDSIQPCDSFNSNVTPETSLTPSSICVDGNHDVWVTLIDGAMVIKMTSLGDTVHQVTAIAIPEQSYANSIGDSTTKDSSTGILERSDSGEYIWMPSKVVADKNNDIWVSYTNQEKIRLIKYSGAAVEDKTGQVSYPMSQLAEISFPVGTHLDDMSIDSSNNLWVLDSTSLYISLDENGNTLDQTHGSVYQISNNDSPRIISTYTSYEKYDHTTDSVHTIMFDKPSTMTFDLSDFLYVVTAGNDVVRINPGTQESVFSFTCGSKYIETQTQDFNLPHARGQVTSIDAMSCDSDNSLLLVNNADKKLYTYTVPENINDHPAPPTSDNYIYTWNTTGISEYLQGSGDWTGIRWIQTYLKTVMGQRELISTKPVNIYPLQQNEILKVNEDHDPGATLESYTLQETINTQDNLLKWFMSTVVGSDSDFPDTLGKVVYEKISNFVSNNSDVDVCNMKNLFSMSRELGVDIKSYDYAYPGSIQRLIDLLSIRHSRLFGIRDKTGSEFTKNGYANNFNHGRNIGAEPIDEPKTHQVSVGDKIIAKELYNNNFTLIDIMTIPGDTLDEHYSTLHEGVTSYTLGEYSKSWNWGLSHPDDEDVFLYYDFYEYVPDYQKTTQVEGVLNWSDQNITVDEDTTYDDWSRDEGLVESLFDKKLRIGIGVTD